MSSAMPKRPSQHVAETASRKAFDALIPNEWTTTPVESDYGLDTRVEIFDGGFATALAFWVQLKGTDESDLSKALGEAFAVSALNYMAAQAEPVLLVRHHGPTGRLFGMWLHRRNIIVRKADQKTVTLRWELTDELAASSVADLHQEARRFRLFRARIDQGLRARVVLSENLLRHEESLRISLDTLSRRTGGLLTFPPGSDPAADVVVTINSTGISVHMSVVSFWIEYEVDEGNAMLIARDAMLLAAACLTKLGRADVAVDIILACSGSLLMNAEELAPTLAGSFAQSRRWREAIDLLQAGSPASNAEPFATLLLTSLALDPGLSRADARYVAAGLIQRAEAFKAVGDGPAAASMSYTAGNMLFHTAYDYPEALDCYESADALWPEYRKRAYFCAELAAAHFENGDRTAAVEWYKLAYELDPEEHHSLAKQADAVAYSGDYESAVQLFGEYEEVAGAAASAIWVLKRVALLALIQTTGVTSQTRHEADAAELIESNGSSAVAAAWALDALAPPAWVSVINEDGDADERLITALLVLCAFSTAGASEPWGFLLIILHADEREDLFKLAVAAGWGRAGEEFVEDVLFTASALEPSLRDPLLLDLEAEVTRLREAPVRGTVRFSDPGGSHEAFVVEL